MSFTNWLDVGSGIAGNLLSYKSTQDANYYSRSEANTNRLFQWAMDSTKYQRAVSDMRAAGINPIMAAGSMGSGTPSGSAATNQQSYTWSPTRFMELKRLQAETDSIKQTTAESRARQNLIQRQAESAKSAAEMAAIDATRKQRTFSVVDESKFGRQTMPYVNQLPPFIRGLVGFGSSSSYDVASKIKSLFGAVQDTMRFKSKPAVKSNYDQPIQIKREKSKSGGSSRRERKSGKLEFTEAEIDRAIRELEQAGYFK